MAFHPRAMSSLPSPPGLDLEQLAAQERLVRSMIRRFVTDPHLVDDLTQDTWLAALRHTAAARLLQRAWLGRVAQNFALQSLRGSSRRNAREATVARLDLDASAGCELDAEQRERVLAAVRTLDEPYRAVLQLRFFEDLMPAEIAARLGLPSETVRTRIKRALRQVQLRLQARG